MFIEKYAERIEKFIGKYLRHSALLNFIILFVLVAAEVASISLLVNSSFSDSIIVKIAAPLLWAAVLTECYFAGWIAAVGAAKDKPKKLKFTHWYMFIFAILLFIAYFATLPVIFSTPAIF